MNKRLIQIAGLLLLAVSIAFIFNQIWEFREPLLDWRPDTATILSVLIGCILYTFSNFLLSNNWSKLLALYSDRTIDHPVFRAIYARTQIAKYIPGNIAHLAGRHVLGRQQKISHASLSASAIHEVLGLCVAAFALGVFGRSAMDAVDVLHINAPISAALLFISMLLFCFAPNILNMLLPKWFKHDLQLTSEVLLSMLLILVGYFVFFITAGLILVVLCVAVAGPLDSALIGLIVGSFAISWLAGFVTPGAPSGVGIREALMVALMTPAIGAAMAIIVSVLFRIITMTGDVLFAVLAGGGGSSSLSEPEGG